MQCPFLKDTEVESCRHSLVRKLIVRNPENLCLERCSSPAYTGCALYATAPATYAAGGARCPYLDDWLVQYCSAAAAPKFIPFSEALLSRCGSAAYRYCDLYIAMAHPEEAATPCVNGIAVPSWLHYAGNHMWLDIAGGIAHIGIDAFLAQALGGVDRITYLTQEGVARPAVVLSAGAADFHMVFPNQLLIAGVNVYLRANSARLTADPYRSGWLFECRPAPGCPDPKAGLYAGGEEATRWMQSETDRIDAFVHGHSGPVNSEDGILMADGGTFAPGVVQTMDRSQAAQLYHCFFWPATTR